MSNRFFIETLLSMGNQTEPMEPDLSDQLANDNAPDSGDPQDVALQPILRGCKAANALINEAASHSYDQWLALAQLLSRVADGRRTFSKISAAYPGYDPADADRKFEEARFKLKPPTCRRIGEMTGGDACRGCAMQFTVNSPYALPHLPADAIEVFADYAAVVHPPMFVNVVTGERYSEKAFEHKFSHLSKSGRMATNFLKAKSAGKVERLVYRPGDPPGIFNLEGNNVLNVWRDTGVDAVPGEFGMIAKHLENLVPDVAEREHVLDYLAHLVQHPAVKIKHVLLIIGGQGIGKSAIGRLVSRLVGNENTLMVGPSEAEDRFKARWGNRQVLVFEELMADNRLKFYNDVKPWITEDVHSVEEKHIQSYITSTPRGMLAFSNEHAPTRVSADDRRFFVVRSPMKKQSADYYDALFDEIDGDQLCAFKHFLLQRDLTTFNPDADPPMTEAKVEMIADTRAPLESRLEELIATAEGPFAKDLVSISTIRSMVREDIFDKRPSVPAVTSALRSLEHVPLPSQVRLDDNSRPRLWAIRNHEKWAAADQQQVREEMAR
ncbi:primase-helicase family protein [Maricaulis sp. MIT060901]|uniref:primase-helicase family protein n=1 Tax=Maricaulis sp. MIT060901 TaxID=3096993 RepID=UPI00399C2542